MDHPDRKPRCTTGLRSTHVSIALPVGELMCLPLCLRPGFFPERGRSSFSGGAPEPRQSASGPHLHPIFELLGNSWQIVRLVQCRCGGGTAVLGDGVHTPCGQSGFVACSWFRQNGVISSHPCCAIPRRKHAGHNASRWAPVLKSKLVLCYT